MGRKAELEQKIAEAEHAGRYRELVPLLEEKLEIVAAEEGRKSLAYGTVLNDDAGIQRDMGEYGKAEAAFLKAGEILKEQLGAEHPDYGTLINNLAGLYRLMGEYDKAIENFKICGQIYEKTLGMDHFLTLSVKNNMGLAYQEKGEYLQAEELYLYCLQKLKAQDNTLAIATTQNNLATLYQKKGNLAEALKQAKAAVKNYEMTVGTKHSLYVYGLNNLAGIYFSLGEYQKAKERFEEAIKLCAELFGKASKNYESLKNNLALTEERIDKQRRGI